MTDLLVFILILALAFLSVRVDGVYVRQAGVGL